MRSCLRLRRRGFDWLCLRCGWSCFFGLGYTALAPVLAWRWFRCRHLGHSRRRFGLCHFDRWRGGSGGFGLDRLVGGHRDDRGGRWFSLYRLRPVVRLCLGRLRLDRLVGGRRDDHGGRWFGFCHFDRRCGWLRRLSLDSFVSDYRRAQGGWRLSLGSHWLCLRRGCRLRWRLLLGNDQRRNRWRRGLGGRFGKALCGRLSAPHLRGQAAAFARGHGAVLNEQSASWPLFARKTMTKGIRPFFCCLRHWW